MPLRLKLAFMIGSETRSSASPLIGGKPETLGWKQRVTSGRPSRLLLALLAAPLGGWMAGSIYEVPYTAVARLMKGMPAHILDALFLPFLGLMFLPVAVVASVTLGLPFHALLATLRWKRWTHYAFAGLLAGSALGYAFVAIGASDCGDSTRNLCLEDYTWSAFLAAIVSGVVPGVGGALTFWAVLRPDRAASR